VAATDTSPPEPKNFALAVAVTVMEAPTDHDSSLEKVFVTPIVVSFWISPFPVLTDYHAPMTLVTVAAP